MSIRHVARTVAVGGAAVLCGALFLLAIDSGVAGADLTSGATTLTPTAPYTSGTPFTSGQQITITVAANGTLSAAGQTGAGAPAPTGTYFYEECEDPGGTTAGLPTSYGGCEAATLGTSDVQNDTTGSSQAQADFPVRNLPDNNIDAGSPTMTTAPAVCGVAPNYCVIGIFAANPNSGNPGFGYPHLWSAPFLVSVGDGLDQGDNPGDGTPELSLAIGLPLAALGVFGIVLVRNRRHRRQAA